MIFLSYRRADARFPATFLASRLKDLYGNEAVFIDYDDLPAGHPWPHHLEKQLADRRVVLVLVGKDWNTPRLRDPDDWVRKEVCTGIRTGKTVLVVRLEGVPLPPKDELPADCELARLHDLQNLQLRAMGDYAADFAKLCRTLERELHGDLKPRTGAVGPWQVPPPVPDFTGREKEFEAMAGALARGGTVMIAAARGIGGAGKTELAKAVAARVRDSFPAGQLFVDLRGVSDNPTTPADVMRQVILTFHPDAKLPDDADKLLPLYRTTLANAGPVLVVLDNAKDRAQVKDLVSVAPPVGFVVTSRAAIRLDGVKPVEIDRLSPDDARALLRGIIGPDRGTDAELDELAGLAAGLPLALRVAGNYLLNDPIETVPDYLAKLRVERAKWLHDDETDVMTVLGYSAGQLIRENVGRAERWQMLSVFPADFDEPATADVMGVAADAARVDLKDLLARGLVQFDDKALRFRLHDLLREVANRAFEAVPGHPSAAETGSRMEAAELRFSEHYCGVLSKAENLYLQGGKGVTDGLSLFDHEKANILAGWQWAVRCQTKLAAAKLVASYPSAGANILSLRLTARERIVWLKEQTNACRKAGNRRGEGSALGNLGLAYADLGRVDDAIEHYRQQLVITREIGDRRGEGNALGNLGSAYADLGRVDDAIEHYRQRLAIAREIGDRRGRERTRQPGKCLRRPRPVGRRDRTLPAAVGHRPRDRRPAGEGNALGNLGLAYAALGRVDDAIEHYRQNLAIAREIGDRRGEGNALGNLGLAYAALGRVDDAIEHYRQQLVIAREIGDRRGRGTHSATWDWPTPTSAEWTTRSNTTGSGWSSPARSATGGGRERTRQPGKCLRRPRPVGRRDRTLPAAVGHRPRDRRPAGEGNALGNLGNAYAALGRVDDAIEHYRQNLAIAREIGDRRGEGNALGNLGLAYAALGRVDDAIEHYRQQLVIAREIGDRRGEGNALGNLGLAYADLGRVDDAIEHYRQWLVIAREIGDRRGEGNALGNLGLAYADLGRVDDAIEHYRQNLAIAREIGDRRGEGSALGNLGNAYAALGRLDDAIEHYRQRLAIAREIGDRRGEGNALGNLGSAYAALGRLDDAIEHYRQRLVIALEIGDRRGEANGSWNLAVALVKRDRHTKAIPFAERSLAYFEEIGHPCAKADRETLAKWRTQIG
ncbi:High-affnity carbon uptake protein Hat/HatR [Fimbriiglobus ruber]|uniref:High-affnity carbon uptake protein Hat/HatR n=1 Tax=Fimbriiglobus ruber TaxID=1908690 RepID=A0A225DU73_9BACT|nr:High-affnity carbon uptake protein Hat/HatR [Fimbriiglobus ruber]